MLTGVYDNGSRSCGEGGPRESEGEEIETSRRLQSNAN